MSSNKGLLGAFDINDGERLHLTFKPFGCNIYADIRVYARLPNGGGFVPTKKGVCINMTKLPALISLIEQARVYALSDMARDLDGPRPQRRSRRRK